MSSQVILSCPFCHHKAEYRDAPPGSTVRCQDCDCIFRVPAISRRKPGSVVKGEEIRVGKRKKLVLVVVLLVLAVAAYGVWHVVSSGESEQRDPFKHLKLAEEGTHWGAVERFCEAWKMEDLELMLKQCRTIDQSKLDVVEDKFGELKLVEYKVVGFITIRGGLESKVNLTVEDPRTKIKSRGEMKPRLYPEKLMDASKKGREVWRVSVQSAVPKFR